MSDTPRTDDRIVVVTILQSHPKMEMVNAPFVRQLERELNSANQIAKKYEDRYFDSLERIKRLEEAGDELLDWIGSDVSDANRKLIIDSWHKAKEAKP